jgi:hypothetical protein
LFNQSLIERGLPMFYKPNYCCNCGEKIERLNWSLTASRRFCEICQTDFVLKERLPQIFVGLMALIGIFGVGSYWRNSENQVNISSKQIAANTSNVSKTAPNQVSPSNLSATVRQTPPTNNIRSNTQIAPPIQSLANKSVVRQTESVPVAVAETLYYCGAATKKGTPCSRRVKGGGRCWQHQGQNALLPPEKLIASQ